MNKIEWGYAVNQWETESYEYVRTESIERMFKVLASCDFRMIELNSGSGRWATLGRPEQIKRVFGSARDFVSFMNSCDIQRVGGWYYNPGRPYEEEGVISRDPADQQDWAGIIEAVRPYADCLSEIGGSYIAATPLLDLQTGALSPDDQIKYAAECWNKVGAMSLEYGIKTTLRVSPMSAIQDRKALDLLLSQTNPETVGFSLDAAVLLNAGFDVAGIIQDHGNRIKACCFKTSEGIDLLPTYTILREASCSEEIVLDSAPSANPAESVMLNNWYVKQVWCE